LEIEIENDRRKRKSVLWEQKACSSTDSVIQLIPSNPSQHVVFTNIIRRVSEAEDVMPPESQYQYEISDSQLPEPDQSNIPLTVLNYTVAKPEPEDVPDLQPVRDDEPDPDSGPSSPLDKSEDENRCYMCFAKFTDKKNMYAHIRKIHSSQPLIDSGIVCPLCKMNFTRQMHLRSHLCSLHKLKIDKQVLKFPYFAGLLSYRGSNGGLCFSVLFEYY